MLTLGGARFQLPAGTERRTERDWEEVSLPISQRAVALPGETLVQLSQFDEFARPGAHVHRGHRAMGVPADPYGRWGGDWGAEQRLRDTRS
jgi:hypothetical protein